MGGSMRVLLLAFTMTAVVPGVVSAQFTVEHVNEEQAQVVRENQLLLREINRTLDEIEKERLKDPGYRSSRVAGARLINDRLINIRGNPGFAPEHERALEMSEYQALALSPAEYGLRRRAEIQQRREQGITALLGPARYTLWQQYLQHRKRWNPAFLPQHSQLSVEVSWRLEELRAILANAGEPLATQQVLPLAKALMAGVQRERQKSGLRDDDDPMEVSSSAFQSAARGRIRENRAGILEDTAPHLNQLQVAAVTAAFGPTGE